MPHLIIPLLAAAVSVLSTAPAYADLGDQLFKLLAKDGAVGDRFGISVAISGATAIVGAPLDDDNGDYSGSAYLFDTTTGQQIAKLLPDDGAASDLFGWSVAINGTTAIVGAPWDDDNASKSGSAYLFDTTTGQQIAKLLPIDGAAGDYFGDTVAIDGTTAIVGAFRNDDNGSNSGSAYLFDTTTGRQIVKLLPDDGAEGDRFGRSVAISGATAIVGTPGDDDNGSAYLFDTTTGRQIAKLLPDDGAADDQFGISVAISGTTAIVGAPGDDDNGFQSGSAYLFDITTGRQITKLLANDGAPGDVLGFSVAISGETAIVGAYLDDDNGSAYLFDITTGRQIAKLLPNDGAADDWFGWSVTISGATAMVGAPLDDDNGDFSGSAYLFDTTTGKQIAKLLPNDGAAGDSFGLSVGICGATAIVGAYIDDDNGTASGSAYLFNTSTGQQIAKLLANDGAAVDVFGFSVAISGTTAVVGAFLHDDNGLDSGSAYLFDTNTGRQIVKLLPDEGEADDRFGVSVAISGAPGKETAIVGAFRDDDNGFDSGSAYLFDASFCPWDLDDNEVVGVSDLLSLLVSWGPCKDCPADFDNNGAVGVSDLLALLANWGPCP